MATEETIIKHQVKLALSMVPGCFFYYNLAGIGAFKGISDIVAIKDGIYYGFEIKTPKGKQSEYQKEFQIEVEAAGGKYFIITEPEQILDIFHIKYK